MLWKKAIFGHQKAVLQNIIRSNIRSLSLSGALRKDHYETLGVKKDATLAEIKNAYFELSKKYHPDRIAATDENLAKFQEITTAYEVLGNEHSRNLYDRGLFGGEDAGSESLDSSDPIVKFYKERHEKSRVQSYEDLDLWTQKYYKEARKANIKGADIFIASKYKEDEIENPKVAMEHIAIIIFLACVYFVISLEHSSPERKYQRFKAWINEKLSLIS